MVYMNPKWIVVDFLRDKLTDPRDRAEDSNSDTFTATSGQTSFTLTPTTGTKMSCISSVTIAGTAKVKWRDYYIDFKNQKVVLFSGATTGQAVVVTYKEGSKNWIYPDKPNLTLSETAFPRINVMIVTGSGVRLGQYEAEVESSIHFQVDIWAKEKQVGQIFTIGSDDYTGEALAEYIAYKVTEAFEDNESDFFPVLYNYFPLQIPRDLPFNEEYQAHHKVVEFNLQGLDIGRVS